MSFHFSDFRAAFIYTGDPHLPHERISTWGRSRRRPRPNRGRARVRAPPAGQAPGPRYLDRAPPEAVDSVGIRTGFQELPHRLHLSPRRGGRQARITGAATEHAFVLVAHLAGPRQVAHWPGSAAGRAVSLGTDASFLGPLRPAFRGVRSPPPRENSARLPAPSAVLLRGQEGRATTVRAARGPSQPGSGIRVLLSQR